MVGMGPAGFTTAHHLMNDGHAVVGIDGLKIEPLDPALSGVDATGNRVPFRPIRDVESLHEALDDRVMAGFGGVAEYGITVRWDKNFLKVARLLVERRSQFALFGGVRFGGTLTAEQAFAMGFDHIALAAGAGKPTVLELPNGLARGVRTASDFLMALQLTGAARTDSIANMQLRLPIVVVGGGLTAIDTATESLAYYPVQVEKFLTRYETLVKERGEASRAAVWREDDREIACEFLAHARTIRDERAAAAREGREARVVELLQSWGGATIAYRKRMIDSPSYTLNHEEIEKALEEGIRFAEELTPVRVDVDRFGYARALTVRATAQSGDRELTLPARSILVAAGTQPNTVLAREDAGHFVLDGRFFRAVDDEGNPVTPEALREARHAQRAALARQRGSLHELLRRPAPVVLRQRGEGHGLGETGLPRREPRAGAPPFATCRRRHRIPREDEFAAARSRASRRAAHSHHRGGRAACAAGGAAVPPRPVLPPAEFRGTRRHGSKARASRWKASRSPAPGSTATRASSRRSCWKWAARATCARCSSPASP